MRVVFINRFFFPDHSATSQLLTDLAFHLARAGFDITVLTSRQAYDNPRPLFPCTATEQGVRIVRVWSTRFGRDRLLGRALDYVTFYMSACFLLLTMVRRGEVVVAKTDPPLISVIAAVVARLRGAVLVNWIQDLFPEVASALVENPISAGGGLLRSLRNWSLRSAQRNVVIGETMRTKLADEGVPAETITVIHNWSDGDAIRPLDRQCNELRREWGVEDKFVVGYSGNFGRAHDFKTIQGAVELLRNDDRIVFLFVGGGVQHRWLRDELGAKQLTNVLFKPYQPRERLRLSLTVPDVHLISLQPALEGLIVPSKFYGIAAAGRPTIYIGDTNGEIPRLLQSGNCGATIALGQPHMAAEMIEKFVSNPDLARRYGQNARALFESRFSRPQAERAWECVLKECVGNEAVLNRGER